MRQNLQKSLLMAAAAALACAVTAGAADELPMQDLSLQLPAHTAKGTPEDLPYGPHIEPLSEPVKAVKVPKGVKNVASGKAVTSSVAPFQGDLKQITDGKKEPVDDDAVEMKKGTQWVQVDLGEAYPIYAVAMWHDHRYVQLAYDAVIQISNDPEFKTGVTTIYNNDADNSSGLGVGTDREYFETEFGRVAAAKGVKARYVRGYSKGGSLSALNVWQEIEVYALPAK
jgi:hypothetical protein